MLQKVLNCILKYIFASTVVSSEASIVNTTETTTESTEVSTEEHFGKYV